MRAKDPRHGSNAGYVAGCRLQCCREARLAYTRQRLDNTMVRDRDRAIEADRKRRRAYALANGEHVGRVDAAPIVAHVRALLALGWSTEAIAVLHGNMTRAAVRKIAAGWQQYAYGETAKLLDLPLSVHVPDTIPDTTIVPKLGYNRRREALLALGHTNTTIADEIAKTLGRPQRPATNQRLQAWRWRGMAAAFESLCMTPGESRKTRLRAQQFGYLPPLAWDDIDDPAERPARPRRHQDRRRTEVDHAVVERVLAGEHLDTTRAEKQEIARLWVERGGTLADLERLHGWRPERYHQLGDQGGQVAS